MLTTQLYREQLAKRTRTLTLIYQLVKTPLAEPKERLRSGSKLYGLLIKLGIYLERLLVESQDLAYQNHSQLRGETRCFLPEEFMEPALTQKWSLFWDTLHHHFPECRIEDSPLDHLASDGLLNLPTCSNCNGQSDTDIIWNTCGHLYCQTCFEDSAPKCDNCGRISKRHPEDTEGVELELDEDEIYYCVPCWEGFTIEDEAETEAEAAEVIVEAEATPPIQALVKPNAHISQNNLERLRWLAAQPTHQDIFSQTIIYNIEQAESGQPMGLYGEILYLADHKDGIVNNSPEPLWKPCQACLSYYRPTYLDHITLYIHQNGKKRGGAMPGDPFGHYSTRESICRHLVKKMLEKEETLSQPSQWSKLTRRKRQIRQSTLKALRRGVETGLLAQGKASYRLVSDYVAPEKPMCQVCVGRLLNK